MIQAPEESSNQAIWQRLKSVKSGHKSDVLSHLTDGGLVEISKKSHKITEKVLCPIQMHVVEAIVYALERRQP